MGTVLVLILSLLEATGMILSPLNNSVTSLRQQQATSASASRAHAESPTPETYIKERPDGEASPATSFHSPPCSIHTSTLAFHLQGYSLGTHIMHSQTGAANEQPPTSPHSGGSKASSNVKGKASTTSSTSATLKSDLLLKSGSDGKLTAIECKCRFNSMLCMFCGATGHMAKECPKPTSRASRGHATTKTLETKPEDSSESNK